MLKYGRPRTEIMNLIPEPYLPYNINDKKLLYISSKQVGNFKQA